MHSMPPDETQLREGPQTYKKVVRVRDTIDDTRNPHYGTGSSIHFQDGPRTYSNFEYLQELWVFKEKWHHQSTEAKKPGASKENWKNNFVEIHAMSSAQENRNKDEVNNQCIISTL